MLDLSVIIVNYNTRNLLKKCLESIYVEKGKLSIEVLVVDNHSTDGSARMIKEKFPEVKLIENRENRGFAAAVNQGLEKGMGKYLLLLNPDTVVVNKTLELMVKFLDENPEVGIVGPKLLNPDGSLQPSCRSFPNPIKDFILFCEILPLLPRTRKHHRFISEIWSHSYQSEVDYLIGACFMFRRQVIEDIGLMDDSFFVYSEEKDYCYRLRDSWKVVFLPEARVIHYGGQSSKQDPDSLIYFYRSYSHFLDKHYPYPSRIVIKGLMFIGNLARILVLSAMFTSRRKRLSIRFKLLRTTWALDKIAYQRK